MAMTKSVSPILAAKIEAHRRWVKSLHEKGRRLAEDNIDLRDVDLSHATLAGADISRVRLDGAILRNTDLSDTILTSASFVQVVLDNALLAKAEASRSNFSQASLRKVRGVSIDLMEANLSGANLTESNFEDADFQEANLEAANFSNANLRRTYFFNARLAHTILTGAHLEEAMLSGATGLALVEIEWIDIGPEGAPQRLEGEQARAWLRDQAAKPRPEWYSA